MAAAILGKGSAVMRCPVMWKVLCNVVVAVGKATPSASVLMNTWFSP